jgi:hypothetical protein
MSHSKNNNSKRCFILDLKRKRPDFISISAFIFNENSLDIMSFRAGTRPLNHNSDINRVDNSVRSPRITILFYFCNVT